MCHVHMKSAEKHAKDVIFLVCMDTEIEKVITLVQVNTSLKQIISNYLYFIYHDVESSK